MTNGSRGSETQEPVVEDWLEEQGGIDWLPEVEEEIDSAARTGRDHEPEPNGHRVSEAAAATLRPEGRQQARNDVSAIPWPRRAILFVALAVLAVLAIIVSVIAFGGGGDGGTQTVTRSAHEGASEQTGARSQDVTIAAPPAAATRPAPSPPPTATKPKPKPQPKLKPQIVIELPEGGRLRRNDTGEAVVTLQKALLAVGFDPGSPDGDFGGNTEAAVIDFQETNSLKPDGIVGRETTSKLNAALKAQASQ